MLPMRAGYFKVFCGKSVDDVIGHRIPDEQLVCILLDQPLDENR